MRSERIYVWRVVKMYPDSGYCINYMKGSIGYGDYWWDSRAVSWEELQQLKSLVRDCWNFFTVTKEEYSTTKWGMSVIADKLYTIVTNEI